MCVFVHILRNKKEAEEANSEGRKRPQGGLARTCKSWGVSKCPVRRYTYHFYQVPKTIVADLRGTGRPRLQKWRNRYDPSTPPSHRLSYHWLGNVLLSWYIRRQYRVLAITVVKHMPSLRCSNFEKRVKENKLSEKRSNLDRFRSVHLGEKGGNPVWRVQHRGTSFATRKPY